MGINEKDEDIAETAGELLDHLRNPDTQELVDQTTRVDPMFGLQRNIIEFFNDRMTTVRQQETLKVKVQSKLEELVEAGEVSFEDLRGLFVTLSKESTIASDSIISLFRPTTGTQSPFAQNLSRSTDAQEEGLERFYSEMSHEDKRKIDVLYQLLSSIEPDGPKEPTP